MAKATPLYESEALNILDSKDWVRTNFLKRYLPSTIDAVRYYNHMGRLTTLPILGFFIKRVMYLYYRYLHTNSLVFPLEEMEKVIENATDIFVDPCPCRVDAGDSACDAPLYTCMRVNHTATLRKEMKGSKGLAKEDALSILRNAYKQGLVLSLESCIQPYQNNICMCCRCCCVAMKARYDYGVGIYHSGPYLPVFDHKKCTGCGTCISACSVGALSIDRGQVSLDSGLCLGCGQCGAICPETSIEMVFKRERVRDDSEPGPIRLFLSLIYIYAVMIPSVLAFRMVSGSKQDNMLNAKPNKKDYFKKSMQ